jgi:hypothetical protein
MYEWLPTECAPAAYPVHLVQGTLALPDGRAVEIPDERDVSNGWGQRGSTHIVGELVKPLPTRLALSWFSYAEDRFWQGRFELPSHPMAGLFARGVPQDRQTGKPMPFERIIVGMAPDGLVAVWAAAGAEVVELAAFQATVAQLPWERVLDNPQVTRKDFIRSVLERRLGSEGLARLQREGIPRGRFASYRTQYRWQPWVTGPGTAEGVRIRSFSGENAFIGPKGAAVPRDLRPVPAVVELNWKDPAAAPWIARITLDEAEAFAAFEKLGRGQPEQTQLALHLETMPGGVTVALRDEKFILPLKLAEVRIFRG